MTRSLQEILVAPSRRPAVVADLQTLVAQEVAAKNGVSGAVVKTGYAAITKLRPGIVPDTVDRMLEQFAGALDPFYAEYRGQAGSDFGSYLSARPEAADALLGVTDARAERSASDAIKKVYGKLRPSGRKNVEEALPRLGALVERHAEAAN
jgi:hypothetical protein